VKNESKSENYSGKPSDGQFFVKNFKKKFSKKKPKSAENHPKVPKNGFFKKSFLAKSKVATFDF